MKKVLIALLLFASTIILASDPVTIDSLFKSQQGLRSVTTLQYVSSGSYDSFKLYPELMSVEDGRYWQDTKSLSLNQNKNVFLRSNIFVFGVWILELLSVV